MSGEQRLTRVYPALTAKERGLLVLHAYKAHEQPDRLIYDTTPNGQARQFNRYIHLMNAVNVELASALLVIHEQVAKTDLRYTFLMTLLICGLETQRLGDVVLAATKDRRLRREVRRLVARTPGNLLAPVDLTLPPEEPDTSREGFGETMVLALLYGIKQGLQQHWCELRAIEIGVQEVAVEFDGEDPLQPEVRDMLDGALRSCTKVRDDVAVYAEFDLPEPTEHDIVLVRRLIEKVTEG